MLYPCIKVLTSVLRERSKSCSHKKNSFVLKKYCGEKELGIHLNKIFGEINLERVGTTFELLINNFSYIPIFPVNGSADTCRNSY